MKDSFTERNPMLNVTDLNLSSDLTMDHPLAGAITIPRISGKNNKRHQKPCKQTHKKQKLCAGSDSLNIDEKALN